MKKTAVIYWSGTGNTKQMAEAVLEGMKNAGAEAVLLEPAQVDASAFSGVDAVAFGCPAMADLGKGLRRRREQSGLRQHYLSGNA